MRSHHKVAPTPSSSSKNSNKAEQPHLSGAYIRSLVKQLSSSSAAARSKDHSTMGTNKQPHSQPAQEDDLLQQQAAAQTTAAAAPPPQQQQQPHKKQVRRRLHTSRPYQERLLNMAEARREIVTALKIHRASMRQAKEQQQQQQLMHLQLHHQRRQEVHHHLVQQEPSHAAATGAYSSAPSYASYSDYLYNSPFSHFTAPPTPSSYSSSPLMITYDDAPVAPPMVTSSDDHILGDHLVPLPAQPLGLNLSFQGFNSSSVIGDETKNSTACSFDPPLLQPSPASSYSVYSSPSVTMASHDLSAVTMENTSLAAAAADPSLHRVLDDEEMAAIYSIGQQHDIEWSDTMNLVTSAWWSKLLESIEDKGSNGTVVDQEDGGAANVTEEASLVDMPDWVSDSLGHVATQEINSEFPGIHLNDYYHQDEDVSLALPRMDIGDIEGWDTEWFS